MHQRFATNRKYVPKVLTQNLNDLTLSWKHLCSKNADENVMYKLQICNEFKEWKTIYWGKRTEFKVDGLAPCTCYIFRIQLEADGNWTHFKGATDDEGPYSLVMHMSRAVKLGKMPLIRKIAHNKYLGIIKVEYQNWHHTYFCMSSVNLLPSQEVIFRPYLLETENKENKTPLVQAIETGDTQILQLLINLGANVNTPLFFNKRTPLMIAVYSGKLQMASILVDKGADVTAIDINDLSVLHYAVDSGILENVKFALSLGLDINCKDNKNWTPLLRAGVAMSGITYLLNNGKTILVILNVSEDVINYLLEHGADVNSKDVNGFDYEKHRFISSLYSKVKK